MKHIMCVRLKQWSIDLVNRKRQRSQRRKARRAEPLVLVRFVSSRQVVTAVCEAAAARGIVPGMTLAEARALCAALIYVDEEPAKDLHALEALARWMIRFTPAVAMAPPDALLLDASGSERLYGGFDHLIHLVSQAVTRLGFHHGIAIAPTAGAAWALASFGKEGVCIESDQLHDALAPLPLMALRIEPALAQTFYHLGIGTIGQLMQLPRSTLPARFGSTVLLRLDEALGHVAQPLVWVDNPEPIRAWLEFEAAVESLEGIWEALRQLLGDVIRQLRHRGCGARKLVATFTTSETAIIEKTIHLSRPTCDIASLFNLLRCATEHLEAMDGFVRIELSVPVLERLAHEQLDLVRHEDQAADMELDHLIERLRARMGQGTVLQPLLVESHLPERAFVYQEATGSAGLNSRHSQPMEHPPKARPLHLLAEPREVRCMVSPGGMPISFVDHQGVHHIACASGPERIAGIWWEGRCKTRDYFDAEDSTGRRFWLFRVVENRRWFLHGIFDG